MAVLELYGKCKELGYCDCGGFFGCRDPKPPAPKPVIENELANAMKAERETSDYRNSAYRQELEAIEPSEGTLVECEVCDRSHAPNHPHIANIDGDVPIDDEPAPVEPVVPSGRTIPPRAGLPDWLKDKQRDTAGRVQTTCDICGKVKRSNHACKGTPAEKTTQAAVRPQRDGRTARELPKPTSLTQPVKEAAQELDPEIAAIAAVLTALDGLSVDAVKRALEYVADRKGIKQGPEQ